MIIPSIAGQLGIQSIPAVIAFVDGTAGRRLHGCRCRKARSRHFIDKIAGPEGADPAAEIEAALGDAATLLPGEADLGGAPISMAPCCRLTRKISRPWPAWPNA